MAYNFLAASSDISSSMSISATGMFLSNLFRLNPSRNMLPNCAIESSVAPSGIISKLSFEFKKSQEFSTPRKY